MKRFRFFIELIAQLYDFVLLNDFIWINTFEQERNKKAPVVLFLQIYLPIIFVFLFRSVIKSIYR